MILLMFRLCFRALSNNSFDSVMPTVFARAHFEFGFTIHNSYVDAKERGVKYWKLTKNMEVETDGKSYQKSLEICKLSIDCNINHYRSGFCSYDRDYG